MSLRRDQLDMANDASFTTPVAATGDNLAASSGKGTGQPRLLTFR